jgi:hypothetical protein
MRVARKMPGISGIIWQTKAYRAASDGVGWAKSQNGAKRHQAMASRVATMAASAQKKHEKASENRRPANGWHVAERNMAAGLAAAAYEK